MSVTTIAPSKDRATRLKDISVSTRDSYMLDPRTIKIQANWNRRDFDDATNREHIEALAQSIARVGVLNPVIVRFEGGVDGADGVAVLADGECRLRATLLAIERGAEIKAIPALAEARGMNEADRLLAQGMRNTSKPMTDIEWASIISGLVAFGWSEEDIATKTGRSLAWVEAKLELAEAPEAAKALVREGTVAAGTVVKAIRQDGAAKATEALQSATAKATKRAAGDPAKVVRVTAKNVLSNLGGASPTRAWRRQEAQGMAEALRAIVAIKDGPLYDAQRIAINCLESLEALV